LLNDGNKVIRSKQSQLTKQYAGQVQMRTGKEG